MTKEFTLRMPDEIHQILMSLKVHLRVSMTSKIMDYIGRGLIADGYLPISELVSITKNERYRSDPIVSSTVDQPKGEIFCSTDSCELEEFELLVEGYKK